MLKYKICWPIYVGGCVLNGDSGTCFSYANFHTQTIRGKYHSRTSIILVNESSDCRFLLPFEKSTWLNSVSYRLGLVLHRNCVPSASLLWRPLKAMWTLIISLITHRLEYKTKIFVCEESWTLQTITTVTFVWWCVSIRASGRQAWFYMGFVV